MKFYLGKATESLRKVVIFRPISGLIFNAISSLIRLYNKISQKNSQGVSFTVIRVRNF